MRSKRAKKCHIWCFSNRFSTKTSHFFKKLTLNLQNFRVFEKTQGPWEKNSSIWRKNSSFLASKLNEPVVTNYTRYHKSVKKKPGLIPGKVITDQETNYNFLQREIYLLGPLVENKVAYILLEFTIKN